MSQAISPSSKRSYGLARVCRVWGVSRASLYRRRQPENPLRVVGKRGPKTQVSDEELLALIPEPHPLGYGSRARAGGGPVQCSPRLAVLQDRDRRGLPRCVRSSPDFATFVTALKAGGAAYLNVHTDACKPGEIRGEIQ